ncbi:MAG TPA: DUF3616 domain-containing protein [Xanthobacteraceae bacterium]|nr:DUF3616 domain-containing protein [Xanthobacteraceae bacterium]
MALVRRARGLAACAFVLVFLTAPARAQLIPPQPTQWLVSPGFGKSEAARMNISGAACAVTTPPFRACLAVNDEESYAQTFRIAGRTLVPGPVVPLLGKSGSDPDAEGAAYDNGYFYAIGSHGLSRHNGKLHESAFLVFRLRAAVQPANAPGEIAAPVETSGKLRAALRDAESVGAFAEKPLNAGGINIEGIAVAGGRLYAGLRAPNLENRGFVLSAALDGVFGNKPLAAKVHALALGPHRGIRDLARVDGGILVLAGPSVEENVPVSVFFWNPDSGALKKLGDLDRLPPGAKAETLLVLAQTPQLFDVLVMFDGIKDGGPIEYVLPLMRY